MTRHDDRRCSVCRDPATTVLDQLGRSWLGANFDRRLLDTITLTPAEARQAAHDAILDLRARALDELLEQGHTDLPIPGGPELLPHERPSLSIDYRGRGA